ncbi:hypothetical protein [Streptomyces sp. NPDC048436]|uniref:hypothetical protein n=1 Tax=Streptomyces sp. NPDC048436 TaxID=3365550 RepID=UPI00372266EF
MSSRFQFVHDHRNTYEVKRLCQALDVNRPRYYASRAFADLCSELGVAQSVGVGGTSADTAACESFHAYLKREALQGTRDYGNPATCRKTVFAWPTRYNTRRQTHPRRVTTNRVSTITGEGPTTISQFLANRPLNCPVIRRRGRSI